MSETVHRPHSETAPATALSIPRLRLMIVLSGLMAFGSISTDMYLPAMPILGSALGAGPGQAELTLSSFLVGFSLGQLLWGSLGDAYGRRWPIAAGMLLFAAGSVGCALSGSIEAMVFWRFIQALGACSGPVLARAMVRDLYAREQAARMLSVLMLVMGIAPLVGPVLGGQMLLWADWRWIFGVQVGLGLLAFAGIWTLPETLHANHRLKQRPGQAMATYAGLLRSRRFLGYALTGGFFYAGIYTYLAGTPFAYIDYYGVAPQLYGVLFGLNICGMMAANLINSRLVMKLGPDRLLRTGIAIAALAGLVLALDTRTGWLGLAGIAVPVFFYVAMLGFVVANSVAGALASFPHKAGSASALVGAMQFGFGAFSSAGMGAIADGTPWAMGVLIGISGVIGLVANLVLVRPIRGPAAG